MSETTVNAPVNETFRFIRSYTEPVTKSSAGRFAGMMSVPSERPKSEHRINRYVNMVVSGKFRKDVEWCQCYCKQNGVTYRVNGQHTSNMFANYVDIPAGQEARVLVYEADDLRGVADLYATFDSASMRRTSSELNTQRSGSFPELSGVGRKTVDLTVSGIGYYRHQDYATSKYTSAERASLLDDNVRFCLEYNAICSSGGDYRNLLMRMPVAAAIYGSFRIDRDAAVDFWTLIQIGEKGLDENQPARALREHLIQHCGKDGAKIRRKSEARELYVRSIHAWNAWCNGTRTALRYQAGKPIPEFAEPRAASVSMSA